MKIDDQQQHQAVDTCFTPGIFSRGGQAARSIAVAEQDAARTAPEIGPNSVPRPPMTGAEDDLDRAPDAEDLLGKEVVVIEGEEHAGDRRSSPS